MATSRALAADGEQIQSTELVVTSALAFPVTAILPPIGDGTAGTVTDDSSLAVWANGAGSVLLKDQYGHLLVTVPPGETIILNARVATQGGAGVAAFSRWLIQANAESLPLKAIEEQVNGAGAAVTFGATTPAAITTPGSVNRFMKVVLSDGTFGYIPVWK